MTQATLTKTLKRALAESIRENRDVLRDLLAEVLEDAALANAIRAGEKTRRVKRDAVLKALAARQ